MGDHEHLAAGRPWRRCRRAPRVALAATSSSGSASGGRAVGRDVPGPSRLDLVVRHPLPRADVGLAQPVVDEHRPDAEVRGDDRRGLGGAPQRAGDQMPSNAPSCSAASRAWRRPASLSVGVGLPLPAADHVPHALAVAQGEHTGGHPPEGSGRARAAEGTAGRPVGTLTPCRRCDCSPRPARRPARDGRRSRVDRRRGARRSRGHVRRRALGDVLRTCKVWVNGDDADPRRRPSATGDEVAVLPPVSGG